MQMSPDSCTAHFPTPLPLFTSSIIQSFVAVTVLLLIKIYVACILSVPLNVTKHTIRRPNYGLGAAVTIKLLNGIGLALACPQLLLYFIFRALSFSNINCLEIACQLQGGITSSIIPFILISSTLLMLITDHLRFTARYRLVDLTQEYLRPTPDPVYANTIPRLAIMPTGRGLWIPPLYRFFCNNALYTRVLPPEIISMDSFGTSLCAFDSNEWVLYNSEMEGVDEFLRVLWTDFHRLPLPNESVDCFVVPTGSALPFLRDTNAAVPSSSTKNIMDGGDQMAVSSSSSRQGSTSEASEDRYTQLLHEVLRVLRPGGTLIASNHPMLGSKWSETLAQLSSPIASPSRPDYDGGPTFEPRFCEVKTLDTSLWWSYLPAKIVVAKRSMDPKATLSSSSTNAVQDAPLLELQGQRGSLAHGARSMGEGTTGYSSTAVWVANAFLALSVLCWILLLALTVVFFAPMQVPSFLPFGQMISSLCVSNCVTVPIVLYFMRGKLMDAAALKLKQQPQLTTISPAESSSPMESGVRVLGGEDGILSLRSQRLVSPADDRDLVVRASISVGVSSGTNLQPSGERERGGESGKGGRVDEERKQVTEEIEKSFHGEFVIDDIGEAAIMAVDDDNADEGEDDEDEDEDEDPSRVLNISKHLLYRAVSPLTSLVAGSSQLAVDSSSRGSRIAEPEDGSLSPQQIELASQRSPSTDTGSKNNIYGNESTPLPVVVTEITLTEKSVTDAVVSGGAQALLRRTQRKQFAVVEEGRSAQASYRDYVSSECVLEIATDESNGQFRFSSLSKKPLALTEAEAGTEEDAEAVGRVWRCCATEGLNLVLLVTVVTVVGWAPFVLLDWLLIRYGGYTVTTVGECNTYTSIAMGFVIFPLIGKLSQWYTQLTSTTNVTSTASSTSRSRSRSRHNGPNISSSESGWLSSWRLGRDRHQYSPLSTIVTGGLDSTNDSDNTSQSTYPWSRGEGHDGSNGANSTIVPLLA